MRKASLRNPVVWVVVVFIAGIVYLISLQLLLKDGVYFSGDSGLKAMIAQNLASGYPAFDMNLPDPPWIRDLWRVGMYPYDRPFVYPIGDAYFPQYPFTFPLVTAPFYALWGYHGLYVVPWAATIGIWLAFYGLCRRLRHSPAAIATGLFFLIFSSHLTFYSATYWEHTLSVCLAFGGLCLVIPGQGAERISVRAALGAGILTGLAVWFRPEQIFVVLFLGIISLCAFLQAALRVKFLEKCRIGRLPGYLGRNSLLVIAASFAALVLYGVLNWLIYKNFFGVHAIQVLNPLPVRERVWIFLDNLEAMTVGRYAFFAAMPVALFVIGYLLVVWAGRDANEHRPDWSLWVGFCVAFTVGVALLVPESAGGKQWGPRFLLMLVPVIALVFTMQLDHLMRGPLFSNRRLRWIPVMVLLALGVAGIVQNPVRGREFFIANNAPIAQVVDDLQAEETGVIGISNAYLSQLFQPALSRETHFVLVPDEYELALFSEVLHQQNVNTFRFLCYEYHCASFPPALPSRQVTIDERSYILHILKASDYERYRILDVEIEAVD